MDNAILVDQLPKIIKILKQRQEQHIALFMLKAVDADIAIWNLIVSTTAYENLTTKKALKNLLGILKVNLSKEILKRIIRLTVLKTDDPFAEQINRAFCVTDGIKYVQSSLIAAFILKMQSFSGLSLFRLN